MDTESTVKEDLVKKLLLQVWSVGGISVALTMVFPFHPYCVSAVEEGTEAHSLNVAVFWP